LPFFSKKGSCLYLKQTTRSTMIRT